MRSLIVFKDLIVGNIENKPGMKWGYQGHTNIPILHYNMISYGYWGEKEKFSEIPNKTWEEYTKEEKKREEEEKQKKYAHPRPILYI